MRLLALIRKELLVLRKDLHGLLVLFIMPAIFILIMSLAMRDTFSEQHQVMVNYLLHDSDKSEASAELAQRLDGVEGFSRTALQGGDDIAVLEEQVAQDRVKFALLIREGFAAGVAEPQEQAPPLLELLVSPTTTPQLERLFTIALNERLMAMRLQPLLERLPGDLSGEERLAQLTQGLAVESRYVYQGQAPERMPTSVQQSVPAWLVFAMFFVIIPLSTAFIVERQQGSLLRLRIMNISNFGLILGKILPYYVINQIQMVLMVLVGIYLVPRFGGDSLQLGDSLLGLFIISSACSLAAIAFALLITTLAKTHTQATTMGGVSNIIFGALGGVMVPKFVMPPFMRELADISPMSWSLEGFLDIFLRNAGWQEVLPEAAALLLFAGACLLLATAAFSRNY
ncbi:MAG: ABC transporter permease [Pseudomonadota bacterium]